MQFEPVHQLVSPARLIDPGPNRLSCECELLAHHNSTINLIYYRKRGGCLKNNAEWGWLKVNSVSHLPLSTVLPLVHNPLSLIVFGATSRLNHVLVLNFNLHFKSSWHRVKSRHLSTVTALNVVGNLTWRLNTKHRDVIAFHHVHDEVHAVSTSFTHDDCIQVNKGFSFIQLVFELTSVEHVHRCLVGQIVLAHWQWGKSLGNVPAIHSEA